MKAKELRIGNAVRTNYGIRTITGIRIDNTDIELCQLGISGEYLILDLIPIQLTEEILLKCGFDFRNEDITKKWYIGYNGITNDWLFHITWLTTNEFPFYRNGFHVIKYLHQLQNLYFDLTGKELDVSKLI